jgi:hypothetical protein
MFGPPSAYVVAISAMVFSALSALTLIYTVRHLDGPEIPPSPKEVSEKLTP